MQATVGPNTTVVDASGGLVLPGFQDSHVHAPFAGLNRLHVDLENLSGLDSYLEYISDYAAAHPELDWIIGGGWSLEFFPGGIATKEALDSVCPDRPVFLFSRDVHQAWVNSEALRRAGISRDTPDPVDGRIERDAAGDPVGTLQEGAAYTFNNLHVPTPDHKIWERAVLAGQSHLHSLGVTGWQDAWVTPQTAEAYHSLAVSGELTSRVVGALWWDRHRGLEQIKDFIEQRELAVEGRFLPTTVKIMVDGVVENYTGALLEPYCDGCGDHRYDRGMMHVDVDMLLAAVPELDRAGFQVHMHAIGDRAVRCALDAVESARAANGPNDNRHHIAHLEVVHPSDLRRFRDLNVIANCQAFWAKYDSYIDDFTTPVLGADRVKRLYPFGDLHRSGATLAMGSDWGVTTANPLEQIEVATRRIDPANRDKPALLPDQVLSVPDAVRAFTAGSAYLNHDSDGGTIAVGKRADLTILDRNIFDAEAGYPADAHVVRTVVRGQTVYES
ncbi:amidohydrolase [Rhodococcus sp. NPDC057529]|uniref:amidohydrolase n=1 Tax=Rhodococcus sp. NPDC057529 TaxID=3346158 RepID=UPI00366B67F7